jgi:hypothetical protein
MTGKRKKLLFGLTGREKFFIDIEHSEYTVKAVFVRELK